LPAVLLCAIATLSAGAQTPAGSATPAAAPPSPHTQYMVGRFEPAYPFSYAPAETQEIKAVLDRVLHYLEAASPPTLRDEETGTLVPDGAPLPSRVGLASGTFQIISYEWGVTYAGMLLAGESTGDRSFNDFTDKRLNVIRRLAGHFQSLPRAQQPQRYPLRALVRPTSLDDSGAMAAALIKAAQAGVGGELRPLIDNYLNFISTGQKRFADGTLARDRPLPDTLWLDDLYMSVPALAQMGKLTGETRYFDDAVKQILQFSQRMFVKENGLYMHGWVEGMAEHPHFHWGRANGWAAVAMAELLSVLPEKHPGYAPVLAQYRAHVRGLANVQGVNGLWHQLLDRPDTYEETSASAMFVYAIARGINRGWLDPLVYGPAVSVGWNAVAEKVNARGQVLDTCVGTGLGWEPVFYAYRPVSPYAAHGYGPLLLAGAEMITLRKNKGADANVHDGGVHFGKTPSHL
jgi:rhamnogalacturonyl hydrolase YesR